MNTEQIWLVAAAGSAVALVLLVACVLLWRNGRQLSARLTDLEATIGANPEAGIETRTPERATSTDADTAPAVTEPAAYVITGLPDEPSQTQTVVATRIDGKLFVDIVARESVVKAAGLAHGLRRALAPESRNRIRFEMKREVKRSRKQRRADLKAALRHLRAEDAA